MTNPEALTPDVHDLATAIYVSRFTEMTIAQAEDLAEDIFTVFQEAAARQTPDTSGLRLCDKRDPTEKAYGCALPANHEAAGIRGHHWVDDRTRAAIAAGATERPLDVEALGTAMLNEADRAAIEGDSYPRGWRGRAERLAAEYARLTEVRP